MFCFVQRHDRSESSVNWVSRQSSENPVFILYSCGLVVAAVIPGHVGCPVEIIVEIIPWQANKLLD